MDTVGQRRLTHLRLPSKYIMSTSPPKEQDVEQNAQSGEEQDHMDREQEGAQGQGVADFDVKEQDRWLPIANGWLRFICGDTFCSPPSLPLTPAV